MAIYTKTLDKIYARHSSDVSHFYCITDSVAQTITFTSLAFFLSSSLTTVSGAPAHGLRTAVSTSNNMEPWLRNPCGNTVPIQLKRMPQRHSVHRTLKRVRTQLRVAQNHFRMHLKDVHEIYSKVRPRCSTWPRFVINRWTAGLG